MSAERQLSTDEYVRLIDEQARQLATTLSAATDAGVSPALIMPALLTALRAAFGEMPAGFTLPGFGS